MVRQKGGANPVWVRGHNLEGQAPYTPNDSNDLPDLDKREYLYVWVGTTGDVALEIDGATQVVPGVAGGGWTPFVPFTKVLATGTTASGILVGWLDR